MRRHFGLLLLLGMVLAVLQTPAFGVPVNAGTPGVPSTLTVQQDDDSGGSFSWQILVTLVGIAITTALTLYQTRRTVSLRRARLKHDLEILSLTKSLNLPCEGLESRLQGRLKAFYAGEIARERRRIVLNPEFMAMTIFGLVLGAGMTVWTLHLVRDGWTWWVLLTGWVAVGGFGQPFIAFAELRKDRAEEGDGN